MVLQGPAEFFINLNSAFMVFFVRTKPSPQLNRIIINVYAWKNLSACATRNAHYRHMFSHTYVWLALARQNARRIFKIKILSSYVRHLQNAHVYTNTILLLRHTRREFYGPDDDIMLGTLAVRQCEVRKVKRIAEGLRVPPPNVVKKTRT